MSEVMKREVGRPLGSLNTPEYRAAMSARASSKCPWTTDRDETLRRLWDSGMSSLAIAEEMLVTKNSIIGRAHRMGLDSRESPIKTGGAKAAPYVPRALRSTLPPLASDLPPAPKVPAEEVEDRIRNLSAAGLGYRKIVKELGLPQRAVLDVLRDQPEVVERVIAKAAATPAPKPLPVCLVPQMPAPAAPRRNSPQCEWIDGNAPRNFVQCSRPSVPGKSWCVEHYGVVFTKRWAREEVEA